jgi:peptide/nickel transport system permease protein
MSEPRGAPGAPADEPPAQRSEAASRDAPSNTGPTRPRAARRSWSRYARVAGLYALTTWAVVTFVFLLPRLMPGDPLQGLDNPDSGNFVYDAAARAKVAAYYGLDRPLLNQYAAYLVDLAHGNLGWSISQNVAVGSLIARRMPWTLLLMGSALALSSTISFLGGIGAAWRRGGIGDRAMIVSFSAARAVPEYATASLLLVSLAVIIPLFPQAGAQTPFARYTSPVAAAADVLAHLALPLAALTLGLAGNKFLMVRNSVVATLGEDYMLLARAKGLPRRVLMYRHSGRNILLPFVTALGVQAGFAAGGSLFVETVFAYPGMGTLVNGAVTARDYPLLQGTFLVLALVVLLVNFFVELTYGWVDPRVIR